MNKKIGIIGASLGENSFGVGKSYLSMIAHFGDPVIIMPNDELINVDLLVLPGGADINPLVYGETPGFHTSNSDVHKQHFYDKKLKMYVDNKTPIFGICLGMQMINTFFGGKLVQHIGSHPQSSSRGEKAHKVMPCDSAGRVIKGEKFEVNSHHHQAVTLDTLSEELIPLYLAGDTEKDRAIGIIEALRHKSLPIVGVQWHYEEWFDQFATEIIYGLLESKDSVLA